MRCQHLEQLEITRNQILLYPLVYTNEVNLNTEPRSNGQTWQLGPSLTGMREAGISGGERAIGASMGCRICVADQCHGLDNDAMVRRLNDPSCAKTPRIWCSGPVQCDGLG